MAVWVLVVVLGQLVLVVGMAVVAAVSEEALGWLGSPSFQCTPWSHLWCRYLQIHQLGNCHRNWHHPTYSSSIGRLHLLQQQAQPQRVRAL
jgi:hypothetical protein